MRRLFRWIVNGLCLLSLLACVGAGWLWATSYRSPEHEWAAVHWGQTQAPNRRACAAYGFGCYQGVLVTGWQDGWAGTELRDSACDPGDADMLELNMCLAALVRRNDTFWERHGLSSHTFSHDVARPSWRQRTVTAPCWLFVAATAAAPAAEAARRFCRLYARRRRRRLGLCLRCGYDLKGNTTGRCSECGEAVALEERRVTTCGDCSSDAPEAV